jgi:hypothetical protein
MEALIFGPQKTDSKFNLTPDHVRGLSLSETEKSYGSLGLYTRLEYELEQNGLMNDIDVNLAMHLGLAMHGNDMRTNGHYTNHIMRVCLRILTKYNIKEPSIIAAALLHDSVEDHPNDLIQVLGGSKDTLLPIAPQALEAMRNSPLSGETVDIVDLLTCPPLNPDNKQAEYLEYTEHIVYSSSAARVVKLSDFVDNAVGNHFTLGSKQQKLDKKYLPLYRIHKMGLLMPDSMVQGRARDEALKQLSKGQYRAMARIAINEVA